MRKSHIYITLIILGAVSLVFLSYFNQNTTKSLSSKASAPDDQVNLAGEIPQSLDQTTCRNPGASCCSGNICDGYYYNVICDRGTNKCIQNSNNQCGGENEDCCDVAIYGAGQGSARCNNGLICQARNPDKKHKGYGLSDVRNGAPYAYSHQCISLKNAFSLINKPFEYGYLSIEILKKSTIPYVDENYVEINYDTNDARWSPVPLTGEGVGFRLKTTYFIGKRYLYEYNCDTNIRSNYESIESDKAFIEINCPYVAKGTYSLDARVKIYGSMNDKEYITVAGNSKVKVVEPDPTMACSSLYGNRYENKELKFDGIVFTKDNIWLYCRSKYPGFTACTNRGSFTCAKKSE